MFEMLPARDNNVFWVKSLTHNVKYVCWKRGRQHRIFSHPEEYRWTLAWVTNMSPIKSTNTRILFSAWIPRSVEKFILKLNWKTIYKKKRSSYKNIVKHVKFFQPYIPQICYEFLILKKVHFQHFHKIYLMQTVFITFLMCIWIHT